MFAVSPRNAHAGDLLGKRQRPQAGAGTSLSPVMCGPSPAEHGCLARCCPVAGSYAIEPKPRVPASTGRDNGEPLPPCVIGLLAALLPPRRGLMANRGADCPQRTRQWNALLYRSARDGIDTGPGCRHHGVPNTKCEFSTDRNPFPCNAPKGTKLSTKVYTPKYLCDGGIEPPRASPARVDFRWPSGERHAAG